MQERERLQLLEEIMPRIKKIKILRRLVHDPCRYVCWREREYLFYTTYSRLVPGEDFGIRYDAPGEFFFCPVRGHLQSCDGCPDWGESGCAASPERIAEKDLLQIISQLGEEENIEWEVFE